MEPEQKEEVKEVNENQKQEEEENNEDKKEENKNQEDNHDNKIENNEEKEEKEEEKDKKEKEEKEEKNKKEQKNKKKENKEEEKRNLIIEIDEENNICVDCEKKYPTKISINNGVIICEDCAKKHELLGNSISFIKDIEDDFDEYLLNFIVLGSNSKFKRFLITEEIDQTLPIEKKYLTKACYFYRKNLKRKVLGKDIEIKKDYENHNEIIENGDNEFQEFDNYKLKSKIIHEGALKSKGNSKLNKIGGSILSVGKKMFGGIKYGANFVAKKTEVPSKNIIKGAGFVGKKIGVAYEKIKHSVLKIKNNNEDKEIKENPPNLNNPNTIDTKRPLQAEEQIKEENNQEQKKEGENIDNEKIEDKKEDEPQQEENVNNEEKIDS